MDFVSLCKATGIKYEVIDGKTGNIYVKVTKNPLRKLFSLNSLSASGEF